ncbi:MAG: hypothetical protein HY436_01025 [Candidatus Liptonbacteria bacterium]|nr:hypothetical protein [Candidatus Liptonbacteria bacterium]
MTTKIEETLRGAGSPPPPSHNLLTQVPAEKLTRPAGMYGGIVLDALQIIAAGLAGFFYYTLLAGKGAVVWIVLAVAFFALVSLFEVLLMHGFGRRIAVLAASSALLPAFFYGTQGTMAASVASAVFLLFLWGEVHARREATGGLRIRFFRIARVHYTKLMTAVVFAFVVLYVPRLNEGALVSQETFERFFGPSAAAAERFYPELTVTDSVETFAESLVRFRWERDPAYQTLTAAEQRKFVEQAKAETLKSIRDTLGFPVASGDSFVGAAYQLTLHTLGRWQKELGNLFPLGWVVAAFLIVRGFGALFYWAVASFAFFLYHFLLAAGALRVSYEPRNREMVEFA